MENVEPIEEGRVDQVIAEIREAPLSKLQNPYWLEYQLLPRLGFNNENLSVFPEELYPWCGYGVKSWQLPSQFSKYLVYLSSKQIHSYLEIGCRHGGTFIITLEYLKRFNKISFACGLDIEHSPIMAEYAKYEPLVTYELISSNSVEGRLLIQERDWDLVLIDGNHNFPACLIDYMTVRDHSGIIVLHDIINHECPVVKAMWDSIRIFVPEKYRIEIVDQYESLFKKTGNQYFGIGLLDFNKK